MARGAQEFGSMDEFLGHKTRGSGGRFLKSWKKKGTINTFMHVARLPMALWRHAFPMYQIIEAKDTKEKVKHVYGKKFTCHESQEVLENPWRDDDGNLKHPPQRCGLHKFDDWLWKQCSAWVDTHSWDAEKKAWVEDKKGKGEGMDPCTLLFYFESEAEKADEESVKLYAGGICNFFGQKELPEDVRSAMRKHKIRGDESYKQNAKVKCEYVMCIVDNDNPPGGVQIAVETQALGDKVKEAITKTYKSTKKNIQKTPYCIQWEYKPEEDFSKKYDATAILDITPSPRIMKLIRGEAPDLSELKTPFNQQSMRSTLEQHCLVKTIPWDEFFPSREQEKKWAKEDEEEELEDQKVMESDDEEAPDDDDDDASESSDGEDEEVACDKCKMMMKLSDPKCPYCGFEYEVEADEEVEESKTAVRTRSETKAAKSKEVPKAVKKKPAEDDEDEDADDDEDEDEEDDDEEEEAPKKVVKTRSEKKKVTSKSKAEDDDNQDDQVPF